ncbi:MAG TPA: flagellar hook-basal body complex protein FliE [Candidatus Avisuccinivibrio pullicola]|nr:flagellar hook-basal body complex protein FliE [Candidatus Avisuccinivibrio pullicola]
MLSSAGLSVQGTTPAVQDNGLIEGPTANDSVGEFAAMLSRAFENVNILQNESSSMQSRFDVGDRSVSLADVMLASQKSSISFEATLQVRNKMVDAYKTIMQMQI